MFAAIDVFLTVLKTCISCLINRKKLPKRSWRGEFIVRLAKALLTRSIGKDFQWIRARQNVLTLYSPDLLKVKSESSQLAGVSCIELQSKKISEPEKVIVFFHGGGYAVGSAQGYQLMGAKLALMCQAKVVLVDYRLVPDFALPAAQDDCYAVTQEIIQRYANQKVILMGDSAGGALCLSTLKRLKDEAVNEQEKLTRVSAIVLISPWVAPLSYTNLSLENECTDMIDRDITQYWVDIFYQSEELAKEVDFSEISRLGLEQERWPKMYLQAAGAEVFLKQVQNLSAQLHALHVPHQLDVYPDQFHVFQTFAPLVPEAKAALTDIANFVHSI